MKIAGILGALAALAAIVGLAGSKSSGSATSPDPYTPGQDPYNPVDPNDPLASIQPVLNSQEQIELAISKGLDPGIAALAGAGVTAHENYVKAIEAAQLATGYDPDYLSKGGIPAAQIWQLDKQVAVTQALDQVAQYRQTIAEIKAAGGDASAYEALLAEWEAKAAAAEAGTSLVSPITGQPVPASQATYEQEMAAKGYSYNYMDKVWYTYINGQYVVVG